MLLAQSLFAQGAYNQAAAATELGMSLLPPDQWGVVVKNYKELYPSNGVYTQQLRTLEAAGNKNPDDPATRFLLGFHYHYLGYPAQGEKQMEKAVQLVPKDEFAKRLLDSMAGGRAHRRYRHRHCLPRLCHKRLQVPSRVAHVLRAGKSINTP